MHMGTVAIDWKKYNNFFELWRAHKKDNKLLYVIGEQRHCYIGSIGSRNGVRGLGTRYQWQYVHRARSIFGADESAAQVAYAGSFKNPDQITGQLIRAAEASVQRHCITTLGLENVLFAPEKLIEGVDVTNHGELPFFIQQTNR